VLSASVHTAKIRKIKNTSISFAKSDIMHTAAPAAKNTSIAMYAKVFSAWTAPSCVPDAMMKFVSIAESLARRMTATKPFAVSGV
jgi:hypothetical protein